MLAISQQIILNNWVCFILGSVANFLLLWLVWKRTPVELRAYSRLLAQAAIFNLANILATQLLQPMVLSHGAYSMMYGLGWAVLDPQGGEANRQWNILLNEIQVFAWYSSFYTMALSLYYRYVIIRRSDDSRFSLSKTRMNLSEGGNCLRGTTLSAYSSLPAWDSLRPFILDSWTSITLKTLTPPTKSLPPTRHAGL